MIMLNIRKYILISLLINILIGIIIYLMDRATTRNLIDEIHKNPTKIALNVYKEDFSPEASKGEVNITKDGFTFSYVKSAVKENAFTAAYFEMKKMNLDLNDFDYLNIELQAEKAERIPLSFVVLYNDSLRQLSTDFIAVKKGMNQYQLNISSFKTPPEWFQNQGYSENYIPQKGKKLIYMLAIKSCHLLPKGIQDEYHVKTVILKKSWWEEILILILLNAVAFAIFMAYFSSIKKEKIVPLPISILELEKTESNIEKISNHIGKNFQNADLSIGDVQIAIGIGKKKIAQELKLHFGLTFPQYVNKIRIEEAKRLLIQSKHHSMSEIGFAVGFNNPSNFNRVFKTQEQLSPKEFLKKTF